MNRSLPLINLVAYIALILINFLAVQLPFYGRRPGDISDFYYNLLTPADFAFKIWPVTYMLLGIFIVAQFRNRKKQQEPSSEVSAIGFLFVISSIINVLWLPAWQSMHIGWSFVLMFALWLVLMLLYYRLAMLEKPHWTYTLPFSVYFAWVCITALANLNVFLLSVDFGFFGLTQEVWTATLVGIGIGGTLLMLYLNKDIWFALVLIWAYLGIYVKNNQLYPDGSPVVNMALIAMAVLLASVAWVAWKKRKEYNL